MEYKLKNGKTVLIRHPVVEDAESIMNLIKTADTETRFLARNPGEFKYTLEQEKQLLENIQKETTRTWFIAEYEGKVVAQCAVGYVRDNERFRHRGNVAFVVLQESAGIGIGGKLMEEAIKWAKAKGITQLELDVVENNERAIKMYKGFGFETIGIMPKALKYLDGTYANELIMVKQL